MIFKKVISVIFFVAMLAGSVHATDEKEQKEAVQGLIKRTVPEIADAFIVEILSPKDRDYFEIESKGNKIVLRGTNGVSVASALNYYLKNYANC